MWFGLRGTARSRIPASSGVRLPLRLLHGMQAVTKFSQESVPPRDRGMTWSMVSGTERVPQYWQANPSRRRILRRDSSIFL